MGQVSAVEISRTELSGNISDSPVDAHAQMLAARVEGLEKELNGLQHVWGRVKGCEAKIEELFTLLRRQATLQCELETQAHRLQNPKPDPMMTPHWLLRRALSELPVTSLLARDIAEFLRNR